MGSAISSKSWKAIQKHFADASKKGIDLRKYFADDPGRAEDLTFQAADLRIDLSKNLITAQSLDLFADLANELNLKQSIEDMYSGEKINNTENRAVLHTALRSLREEVIVDGENVIPKINAERAKMYYLANAIISGEILGCTGKRFTSIVNIGIGGSDLGPKMAYSALLDYKKIGINAKFVSNVDPNNFHNVLKSCDPETTMFIIVSKTFSTQETMANALLAKQWLRTRIPSAPQDELGKHFFAVSSNVQAAKDFGIDESRVLAMWDWVGGRYSLASSVGFSLAIAIGPKNFDSLLLGMRKMDSYFIAADPRHNAIMQMAILNVCYIDIFGAASHAILPYSELLDLLPNYLQQLIMESNGKSVRANGKPVESKTGEIIWGAAGTNGQHAFYQLIHQGTLLIPCDFIAARRSNLIENPLTSKSHMLLLSNVLAQSAALAFGKSAAEVRSEDPELSDMLIKHKTFTGNRPSSIIMMNRLSPDTFGQLIALYEHITFIQGKLWDLNSFDQWGVELGKKMANDIYPFLDGEAVTDSTDSSTAALIEYIRS